MSAPDRGEVIVATDIRHPGGPTTRCPAAPLVAGCLRRRGVRTRTEAVTVGEGGTLLMAVWPMPQGDPVGLGIVADGPGGVATGYQALESWIANVRRRRVVLAGPRSFCAGVERAIEIVERLLASHGAPVYVRKQIVHNAYVVKDLEDRGAVFVDELDQVPDDAVVVFSAHGVAPAVRAEAARRGLDVVDATCPLVTKVHQEARRYADRGDTVVLIGHAGHEEVDGTLGEAPSSTVLVADADDVAGLVVADPRRVSYLTQTTLAVDETADVVTALRARFPDLRGPRSDDICYATTNRQDAVRAVATDADLVLVIGSGNSSNSVRLVEVARRQGTAAYLVDGPEDIHPEWLAGVTTVGLTAGASAPPALVDQVVAALGGLGPIDLAERTVAEESIRFALPSKVWRS